VGAGRLGAGVNRRPDAADVAADERGHEGVADLHLPRHGDVRRLRHRVCRRDRRDQALRLDHPQRLAVAVTAVAVARHRYCLLVGVFISWMSRHEPTVAVCRLPAKGSTAPRSSCGRGMTCTPTTSPTRCAAAAPASIAALTAATSPTIMAVTMPE